jgi:hypothetical protein
MKNENVKTMIKWKNRARRFCAACGVELPPGTATIELYPWEIGSGMPPLHVPTFCRLCHECEEKLIEWFKSDV